MSIKPELLEVQVTKKIELEQSEYPECDVVCLRLPKLVGHSPDSLELREAVCHAIDAKLKAGYTLLLADFVFGALFFRKPAK